MPRSKPRKDEDRETRQAIAEDADKTEGKDRDLVHGDGGHPGPRETGVSEPRRLSLFRQQGARFHPPRLTYPAPKATRGQVQSEGPQLQPKHPLR